MLTIRNFVQITMEVNPFWEPVYNIFGQTKFDQYQSAVITWSQLTLLFHANGSECTFITKYNLCTLTAQLYLNILSYPDIKPLGGSHIALQFMLLY